MTRSSRSYWVRAAALMAAVAVTAGIRVSPAMGAFELRDASPAALGGVSIDLESEPMLDAIDLRRAGIRFGASHSALYQIEGLAQDRAWIRAEGRMGSISLACSRVGVAGAVESGARLALRESRTRVVALEVSAERLDLALDGEAREGGWAFGGSARARLSISRIDLEVDVAADRFLRSAGLGRLSVPPSVPVAIRLRSGGVTASWLDRWGGDGRRSPRIVLDMPIAGAARVRLGRGEAPERIGAALAVRVGRIEVSAGRMDQSAGSVITGAAIGLLPAASGGGR